MGYQEDFEARRKAEFVKTRSLVIKCVVGGFAGFIGLSVLFGSFYTIDQGERGIVLRNGAVIGEAQPGMGFKAPFIESVETISVQDHKTSFGNVKVYSADQQPATLRVSINYHVTDVRAVYTDYKTLQNMLDRLVAPQVFTWSENIFGHYEAATAVQDRARLNNDLALAINKVVKGPLAITSIQIENIDFSGKYEEAVEARMQAAVAQQQAVSEAASKRTASEAEAYAVKVKGDAEAGAIRARGDALRDNPGLPELVVAEKWDGKLPQTMVPGTGVPFISVGRK